MPTFNFSSAYSRHPFIEVLTSMMQPSDHVLERARKFTSLKLPPEQDVSIAYIQEKIKSEHFPATHLLQIINTKSDTLDVPVIGIILLTQCMNFWEVVVSSAERPVLSVKNVPDIPSFKVLLRWLYSNDEDELYKALSRGCDERMLVGFIQNCKFWGIVDERVIAVVIAVVERNMGLGCLALFRLLSSREGNGLYDALRRREYVGLFRAFFASVV
jgi:hypothetical protein